MTHPVQGLRDDHRQIEKRLNELDEVLRLPEADAVPISFLRDALEYFRSFADGVHHRKEEQILFPLLEQKGVPVDMGPIGVMLREHDIGRSLLGRIGENLQAAEDGNATAMAAIWAAARDYVVLLREHIWKEDNVLFPLAEKLICGEREQEDMRVRMVQCDSAYASATTGLRN